MMSWISNGYECRLCMTLTWSDLNPPCIILYGWQAACHWWSVRICSDKQEVRYCASLNLSHLCYGCQRCTLAVAQHCPSPWISMPSPSAHGRSIFRKIFKHAFKIYGIWPQARTLTHFCNAVPLVWGSLRLAPMSRELKRNETNSHTMIGKGPPLKIKLHEYVQILITI